jgi:hypothetical protein
VKKLSVLSCWFLVENLSIKSLSEFTLKDPMSPSFVSD